jgi:hypothetical protein
LLKTSLSQSASTHSCCFGGNPRSGYFRSDDDDAFGVALPLEGIVFGAVAGQWRKEGESSTASMTASFGGVVQRGLGDGCAMMDSHRAGALSGAVVASMVRLVRDLLRSNTQVTSGVCAQGIVPGSR